MYFDNFVKAKKTPGIPRFKMNAPLYKSPKRGDVGIEFEFEATNNLPTAIDTVNSGIPPCPVTRAGWTVKEDHSLRGGFEYVTQNAVSIEAVPDLVNGLYGNIAKYKTKLRLSNRCSTHVHLNASTWKIDQLVSFYLLWALFEPLLVDWCGPRRKTNHFCLSILDAPSTLAALNTFLKTGEWRFQDGDKYSALNLRRLHDIGTVEVRCGDAWPEPSRPIEWIKFLHGMAKYATAMYPNELPARISGDTPLGILAEICNIAETPTIYQDILNMSSDTELASRAMLSFREAMHLAFLHPWDEWRPLINKEYIPNPFDKPRKGEPPGDQIERLARAFAAGPAPIPRVRARAPRAAALRMDEVPELRVEPEAVPDAPEEPAFLNEAERAMAWERELIRQRVEEQQARAIRQILNMEDRNVN